MLKIFQKFKSEKGATIADIMIVLATMSIVVGGVAFQVSDIFNAAQDTQRVANIKQIINALELYYSDNNNYPQAQGATSTERFDSLTSQLAEYLESLPSDAEKYDYQDFNSSEQYLIRVLLEDPADPALQTDIDGEIQGLDCNDPFYCIAY